MLSLQKYNFMSSKNKNLFNLIISKYFEIVFSTESTNNNDSNPRRDQSEYIKCKLSTITLQVSLNWREVHYRLIQWFLSLYELQNESISIKMYSIDICNFRTVLFY